MVYIYPLNSRHSARALKAPIMPSFLWSLSGPGALTATANFCPQELCSQGELITPVAAECIMSRRSKRLLITERKARLHLLNDGTQRIIADVSFSNKDSECWPYAKHSAQSWDMVDKTNVVPDPLGAQDLMGSSGFSKSHLFPRADVHGQGIQLFSSLHPAWGSFQVPQGRNQCSKPHLY